MLFNVDSGGFFAVFFYLGLAEFSIHYFIDLFLDLGVLARKSTSLIMFQ